MISLALSVLLFAPPVSFAQKQPAPFESDAQHKPGLDPASPESIIDCGTYTTWVFGSGGLYSRICASEHGNITRLQSPAGFEHLRVVPVIEGYTVSVGSASYYDAGNTESGWGPTTLDTDYDSCVGGYIPIFTRRTTNLTGAVLELRQEIYAFPQRKEIIIVMAVRNLSPSPLSNVRVTRYFDGDIDNNGADDIYDRTADSVTGKQGVTGHGLTMDAINSWHWGGYDWVVTPIPHSTAVLKKPFNPRITNPTSLATPTARGDYLGLISYNLGVLEAGNTSYYAPQNSQKKVAVRYIRF
jgi:hypothetical protein